MKPRLLHLAVFCAAILSSFGLAAQDKPTAPASQLSGVVTMSVGESNLLNSPYVAGIPGISSGLSAAGASIKFTDGVSRSYLDVSQPADEIIRSRRIGYEAAVVFDAAALYAYTTQTTKLGSNGDSSFYSLLQPMIDWYENNKGRFGLASNPYSTGSWPTDNYDGSTTGRTRFIYGKTVEPLAWVAWNFSKWYDAQKLVSEIKLKIELAIDGISPDASSGKIIDQYSFAQMPQARRDQAQAELKAWTDFHVVTDGVDSKATLAGPLVQSAYIKFTNIGGVLDARLDFAGAKVSSASLLPSPRMEQPATGPALGFALPIGLVPNLSLSATASLVGGSASIVENYETKNSEALAGEASWLGLKLKGGYNFPELGSVNLTVLWPDLVSRPLTLGTTLDASFARDGELSWSCALEGDLLYWQDRYNADAAPVLGYGAGVDATLRAFGAAPHVFALYKSAGYWGQGGNDLEDRFPGTDLRADFNAVKVKDALALDLGLGFDAAPFVGMKLASIEGGYRLFMYDLAGGAKTPGQGWYAGATFSLVDLARIPLALSGKVGNYADWGLYAGSYADWGQGPAPGLFTGLSWTANLDFDPTREIRLSLEGSGRETGWRMDTQRLLSLGLKASIRF